MVLSGLSSKQIRKLYPYFDFYDRDNKNHPVSIDYFNALNKEEKNNDTTPAEKSLPKPSKSPPVTSSLRVTRKLTDDENLLIITPPRYTGRPLKSEFDSPCPSSPTTPDKRTLYIGKVSESPIESVPSPDVLETQKKKRRVWRVPVIPKRVEKVDYDSDGEKVSYYVEPFDVKWHKEFGPIYKEYDQRVAFSKYLKEKYGY